MTVQRLYRGQDATVLTKYTLGGRERTYDEIKKASFMGARGILNNPIVDGYIKDNKYVIDEWEHYSSEDELVSGWIAAGYPASWYYIYTDKGMTYGAHRFIGQVERLFYIKGDRIEWVVKDGGGDPGRIWGAVKPGEWMA